MHASSATNVTAVEQSTADDRLPPEIIVISPPLFRDITPEAELDEDGIASYGVSTVDELLLEIHGELDEGEEPLILVNGERLDGLEDIGAYPVEVLRNVQILPRGSAVRVGGRTGQRVISLTLQRRLRSATLTAAPRVSTDGDWSAARGETLLTYLQGSTRANIGFRYRGEGSLLERDRDILQPQARLPFAIDGNVVGFPDTSGEIDPFLSAIAGQPVTVTPIPAQSSPTLADFAAQANQENFTDLGRFRTLVPRLRNYDLNATVASPLAPWLTTNATFRLTRNVVRSLRGLPSGLFVLSPDNAFSPFSTDVGLAVYGRDPLQSRSQRESGEARVAFNGRFGQWRSNLNLRHFESKSIFDTERQSSFGSIPFSSAADPFGMDLADRIAIRTDRSSARSVADLAQLSFTGPALSLPAGDVIATVQGQLAWDRLRSRSSFLGGAGDRTFRRAEQSIRSAVEVPITTGAGGPVTGIGEISGTAEYSLAHFSDAGTLDRYGLGLIWEPVAVLRLQGTLERAERAPSMHVLGNPVVETPDVRVFDPLVGSTVDVLQITGGNPDIRPERVTTRRVSALLRPLPRSNLQINAEYTDLDARNFISSLPQESLPVMLAFPERYIRNSDGVLTTIDLRPVNFDSHRQKRVRWGLSFRRKIGGGGLLGRQPFQSGGAELEGAEPAEAAAEFAPASSPARGRPATYVQFSANHTAVISDRILIRPMLDPVDLLGGGAIGIAGGRVRHQVDGNAALTSGGLGARLGLTWQGASTLETRFGDTSNTLRFSPLLNASLRLFADGRRLFPDADWARGSRVSVNVVNLTNQRQRVRDPFGKTPLQYQPGYRDPLGRTIEFELRKVF